jgi:hypothetical protein
VYSPSIRAALKVNRKQYRRDCEAFHKAVQVRCLLDYVDVALSYGLWIQDTGIGCGTLCTRALFISSAVIREPPSTILVTQGSPTLSVTELNSDSGNSSNLNTPTCSEFSQDISRSPGIGIHSNSASFDLFSGIARAPNADGETAFLRPDTYLKEPSE